MVSIDDINTLQKSKQKIYIVTFKYPDDVNKFKNENFSLENER